MAKGIPMFSLADTTHPPKGMTPWGRNRNSRIYVGARVIIQVKNQVSWCCSSPWGGCWSNCWSQSFSSRSLHSRARSCLWWWRIFVPRKTMKAAVSQPCGTERNQRLPMFSTQNRLVWCVDWYGKETTFSTWSSSTTTQSRNSARAARHNQTLWPVKWERLQRVCCKWAAGAAVYCRFSSYVN